jgi:DNA primase
MSGGMYDRDLIDKILASADIVTIISSLISPSRRKAEATLRSALFTTTRIPRSTSQRKKQIFKCFVCGTGGNAITFVEKIREDFFRTGRPQGRGI